MKTTHYSKLNNLLLIVSFNQSTGDHGQDIQPIVVEARGESVTTEGAVLNVKSEVKIGDVVSEPLTNEEIYKTVYGVSEVLAEALKGVLLDGVNEDVSSVDVSKVKPVKVSDIAVEAVIV